MIIEKYQGTSVDDQKLEKMLQENRKAYFTSLGQSLEKGESNSTQLVHSIEYLMVPATLPTIGGSRTYAVRSAPDSTESSHTQRKFFFSSQPSQTQSTTEGQSNETEKKFPLPYTDELDWEYAPPLLMSAYNERFVPELGEEMRVFNSII